MANFDDLTALGLRIGTVVRAEPNVAARHPAIRLWIDFGPLGILQSSARITDRYAPAALEGRQVVAVTAFAPLRVGGFRSDVLVLGGLDDGGVVLLGPDEAVPPGTPVA